MKGQLRIDVLMYDPEHVAGKPYRRPTYSTVADASRISIKDQAREYSLWLIKNNRSHCVLYSLPKSGRGVQADFRHWLFTQHNCMLRYREVEPQDFLGKLSDRDRERLTCKA